MARTTGSKGRKRSRALTTRKYIEAARPWNYATEIKNKREQYQRELGTLGPANAGRLLSPEEIEEWKRANS